MNSTISDRSDAVDRRAFLDGGEFLVRDRDRSGQPQAAPEVGFRGWHRALPCGPHRSPVGRVRARCNRASARYRRNGEVRPGSDFLPAQQLLPGKARRPVGRDIVQRVGEAVEDRRQRIEVIPLDLDASERGDCAACDRPRQFGLRASIEMNGVAASSWPSVWPPRVSTGRNSSPFFSKNSPPSGLRTAMKQLGLHLEPVGKRVGRKCGQVPELAHPRPPKSSVHGWEMPYRAQFRVAASRYPARSGC